MENIYSYNVTTEYDLDEIKLRHLLNKIGYYPGDNPSLIRNIPIINGPILEGSEYLRITNSLSKDDQLKKKIRQNEKEYLHKRSQDRIKNWKNTITGQRRMKDEIRRKRLEELEEEKRKENEIFLQNEKKKREATLEKVKQIRIQELDSVKSFDIKLRHFQALRERKLQIENKKFRQRLQEEYEKQINEHYKEIKKAEAEEDKKKLEKKLQEAKVVDDYNKALREKRKIENALIKQMKAKDRELAVQKDLEDKEKEKEEVAKERAKLKVLYNNFKQKEIENKMKKEREKIIEEKTKQEIDVYNEKKEKQIEMRQQREIELRNKNNPNKEIIYKIIEEDNKKKKKKIEDFQTKWLDVIDEQAINEKKREKKNAQFKKELYQAYLAKREEKKKKRELQEKKGLELSKMLKEYDELTKKMEQYSEDQKKLEREKVSKINNILREEQAERKKKYKEDRNEWGRMIKHNQDLERKQYENYIKSVSNESWVKDNELLQRYIKGQLHPNPEISGNDNPRFMCGNLYMVNTWERLGFTGYYMPNDLKLSSGTVGSHKEYLSDIKPKKYVSINYDSLNSLDSLTN